MDKKITAKIKKTAQKITPIKLVYFFGSRANGNQGPLSDYDFAIYLNERNPKKIFKIKLDFQTQLNKILKSDQVDVVVLDTCKQPELKYNIIKEGQLIYEVMPFRIIVEPRILSEYFDFNLELSRYGLTKIITI